MRGERSLETKARFRRLWDSDQLADLGPERPRPCRQYMDPPWPRCRVSARPVRTAPTCARQNRAEMSLWRRLSALLDETVFLPVLPPITPHSVCQVASLRAGSTLNAIVVGCSSYPSLDRRRQRRSGVFLFASCSLSLEEQFIGLKLSNSSSLIS